MFSYPPGRAVSQPLSALVVPPTLHADRWGGLLGLSGPDAPRLLGRPAETRGRRSTGEEVPVEITVTQLSASPLLLTGFVRDLSVVKQIERRGERLERLLATAEQLVQMGSWDLDLQSRTVSWSDQLYRIMGFELGQVQPSIELTLDQTHSNDKDYIGTLLSTVVDRPELVPVGGVSFDYRFVRPDGSIGDLRAHGRVEFEVDGGPTRWIGSGQDISNQRLAERELLALRASGEILRDWETSEQDAVEVLGRLSTALELSIGLLWTWDDERERLSPRGSWFTPGVDLRELDVRGGAGMCRAAQNLAERVCRNRTPLAIPDMRSHPGLDGHSAMNDAGVRSALVIPAVAEERVVAVLSFYGFERWEPTKHLIVTLREIGAEFGRSLVRRSACLSSPPLSARELEVLRLATEGNSGPDIASCLTITPATVKTHFENIYAKLGVRDRAAAVAVALRGGLIR
jgi:DNA-binding CsgD family transcriptional regulator/PAS domain-containing protein